MKDKKATDLIERYIYAVTQRVPEQQRPEIKQELHGLIEDMLEERAGERGVTQHDAEGVLLDLGPPHLLAAKYRGYERYLIGPLMFDSYITTLKIVLISVIAAMTGMFAIASIVTPSEILKYFTDYMASLFIGSAQGFGWVTLIFALIDYRQTRSGKTSLEWKPSELPLMPDSSKQIKMSEPIAGIIFTVLFAVICLYSIELFGIWTFREGQREIFSFFDAVVVREYLPIIWVVTALGILKESVRIIIRKRTGNLLVFHICITVIVTALVCISLADPTIWNADFMQQLEASGILTDWADGYEIIESVWTGVNEWLIVVIAIFAVIDIISETYKWHRAKTAA